MSFKAKEEELDLRVLSPTDNTEYQHIEELFSSLANDSDPGDTSLVDAAYHTAFLFCDPQSSKPIQKEDFLKYMPMMSQKFAAIGFKSKKAAHLQVVQLDSIYFQAFIEWEMVFERQGKSEVFKNIKTTYMLKKEDQAFKIIMQMDHQNLFEMVN